MSNSEIHIGDHVRFLNTTGGGVVKSISPKGVVQVEDESGFDIPVLASEIVVVTPGSTIVPKVEVVRKSFSPQSAAPAPKQEQPKLPNRARPSDEHHETINAVLAYLPEDPTTIGECNYEAYIVNDSNYDLRVHYLIGDGSQWEIAYEGVIPFDSSEFIESFPPGALGRRIRVKLQIMAFKPEGTFAAKPIYEVTHRLEGSRFFKQNAFVANDYFDDGAIIFGLIEDDRAVTSKRVDAKALEEEMMSAKKTSAEPRKKNPTPRTNDPVVVDLHIHELIDTTAGMSNKDMLDVQLDHVRKVMQLHRSEKKRRIVFIHGKGEGVLRQAVIDLLKKEYPKCLMQDASFQEYGFGATEVTIY